jgi:hypothetical protein
MTSQTPRLNLTKATVLDPFVTQDIKNNWNKIDSYPGEFICTSTTRPNWTAQNIGQSISETDTGLSWKWDGAQFIRRSGGGTGVLPTGAGQLAFNSRSYANYYHSDVYVNVLSVPGVLIPSGNRPLRLTLSFSDGNLNDLNPGPKTFYIAIVRSLTGGTSGTIEQQWEIYKGANQQEFSYVNGNNTYQGDSGPFSGQTLSTIIPGGLPAGPHDWSMQMRNDGYDQAAIVLNNISLLIEEM